MIVPTPPSDADAGMPTSKAFENGESLPNAITSGTTDEIIMAVVAVLDIIMLAKPVVSINPNNNFSGRAPNRFTVNCNNCLSSSTTLMAFAKKNPPNNNQITLLVQVSTYILTEVL